jgi:transposase
LIQKYHYFLQFHLHLYDFWLAFTAFAAILVFMSGTTKITASTSTEQLPTDVKTLQQMVLTLLGQIDDLSGQLHYLKRQLFGKKSEKLSPDQRLLFENLYNEIEAKIEQQKQPKTEAVKKPKNANHTGRKPLPPELPRETIEIMPSQDDQTCGICNDSKDIIGTEVTEKLEYRPACFFVKRYVRYKMGCRKCQGNISIGQLPPMVVDKGIAGEGLLAHVITSKYCDHAPLNRLEDIFKRSGVDINVSTMCDWVGQCSDLLEPLVKRMHEKILLSPKINSDDSATSEGWRVQWRQSHRVKSQKPVAWMAGKRETNCPEAHRRKPFIGMVSESPGRNESKRIGGPERISPGCRARCRQAKAA